MATGIEKSTVIKSVNVRNAGSDSITVCVEPWGDEYSLNRDEILQVVFDATEPGEPEVLHQPDRVLVYGWPTAAVRVLKNGADVRNAPQA
jgi:hypothetical protein